MVASHPVYAKQFRVERRRFEQTVLFLQGGGALGAEQAGLYGARPGDVDGLKGGGRGLRVGAGKLKTANFVYFDSTTHRIGPAHIIASGSLPPGFPATEIDGEHYWDGGLVSNTPLQWVLDSRP